MNVVTCSSCDGTGRDKASPICAGKEKYACPKCEGKGSFDLLEKLKDAKLIVADRKRQPALRIITAESFVKLCTSSNFAELPESRTYQSDPRFQRVI